MDARGTTTGGSARSRASAGTLDEQRPDGVRDDEITSIIPIDDFGLEQYADGPLSQWRNESDAETRRSTGTRRFDRDAYDKPRPAEITQDIVVAEIEFDEIVHEHPFDVRGAEFDDFAPNDDAPEWSPRKQRSPVRSGGKHRIAAPPQALKGRAALLAVAAGAAVAAATGSFAQQSDEPAQTAAPTPVAYPGNIDAPAAGLAAAPAPANMDAFTAQLATGQAIADAKKAEAVAALKPTIASPIALGAYDFTSAYASRWGSFHGGIDMAAPLGTPIHAVTDGVVIEAGPASGYGHWVQIQAPDGTVTMYGHMSSSGVHVQKGQTVTAGDVIAEVGNEGFSTGPHLHFEVWKNGTTKTDPTPWLASHGVQLSGYTS
ncbi:M23 family metallopeptidase [Williamsia sp.]|uniref:M23 family metallopeptidase n=1 Tax=Williamsia sp. TaxID=1872085 RepID=UPI002F924489